METVELYPDGSIREQGRILAEDPLCLLGRAVELAQGYSLRAFFRMLGGCPELTRLSPFLPGFVDKLPGWPPKSPIPLGLSGLVLDRTVEMIGFPGPARLEVYASLRGAPEQGEGRVEIKPHPVETLLDVPLALGPCTLKLLGDSFEDMVFATVFSLFEFIDAVSWQLTFHGSPMECALRR